MSASIPFVLAQADAEGGIDATTAVGWTIFGLIVIGFAVAVVINVLRGRKEVGAELELAANRKPYLSDEELEGKKLDRSLGVGLATLAVIGVALPLYWLGEPSRQENAVDMFDSTFVTRGEGLYVEACAACHGPGAVGGVAETPLVNERGEFVEMVAWQSPALDTVLYRYSREEVFEVLQYGRPQSPMPAWGELGGGPWTDQQLWNVIDYLESIQLPAAETRETVADELERTCDADADGVCADDMPYDTEGEAMFNMGLDGGLAGGAFSCGRCHTKGWSYGQPEVSGGGFLGPALTGGSVLRQFPSLQSQLDFIALGAERGQPYGAGGTAYDGTMPGYGINPNAAEEGSHMSPDQVMYSDEQIRAVVEYERGL